MKPTLMIALEIPARTTSHVLILSAPVLEDLQEFTVKLKVPCAWGRRAMVKGMDFCQNGGVCMEHSTHYSCKCKAGFTGENCTTHINDCVNEVCQV